MRTFLLLTLFTVCLALPAHARLDESESDCAERYGPATPNGGGATIGLKSFLYHKNGITIYATFLDDGDCVDILFHNDGAFDPKMVEDLLDDNAEGKTWTENDAHVPANPSIKSWVRSDGATAGRFVDDIQFKAKGYDAEIAKRRKALDDQKTHGF